VVIACPSQEALGAPGEVEAELAKLATYVEIVCGGMGAGVAGAIEEGARSSGLDRGTSYRRELIREQGSRCDRPLVNCHRRLVRSRWRR
jgi:hypothetical protein